MEISKEETDDKYQYEPAPIIISGAGIVGLVLALALHKHVGVKAELYDQASAFQDGIGAAIGMYPNGLRVIRDISTDLLDAIRDAGFPYEYRRWMRHDGTEVAVAKETALQRRDDDLHSIGIRRWRLQKILYDAVVDAGIPVHFGKRLVNIAINKDGLVDCSFEDGTHRVGAILFGADGSKSKTRDFVAGTDSRPCNTGTTCLMGIAEKGRPAPGICFPSALTTRCHGAFFPTGENEQCFQFHFPIRSEHSEEGSWGVLGKEEGKRECLNLAAHLKEEGWDSHFTEPLLHVNHVVRIGFCLMKQGLQRWVNGPVALIGDAAHPPVPYIGQGAQMGIEDAGVIAQLLKGLCFKGGTFDMTNCRRVMRMYEKMRIPRTTYMLSNSKQVGMEQQRRADSRTYNLVRESSIRLQVMMYGTLPIYLPGVKYDYKEDVAQVLLQVKIRHQPSLFTRLTKDKAFPTALMKTSKPRRSSKAKMMLPESTKIVSRSASSLRPISETITPITFQQPQVERKARIAIVGAGIAGLLLALSLDRHIGVKAEVFEGTSEFKEGHGAAVALHPNSLRVIADISSALLDSIRTVGVEYKHQRWMRKDGRLEETPPFITGGFENDLQSIGIRHWRLQRILLGAASEAGIPIHFGRQLAMAKVGEGGMVECYFSDGSCRIAEILFGADGVKSKTRDFVSPHSVSRLKGTGITCITGISPTCMSPVPPSVCDANCHACYFPVGEREQCFQFHLLEDSFRKVLERKYLKANCWREMDTKEGRETCTKLAECLREDGWDESFLVPLRCTELVIKIRFLSLDPKLCRWTFGHIALLGDAAHPPVPFVGQGCQMGIEDAAIIAQLLKRLCHSARDGSFDLSCFEDAMHLYEAMQMHKAHQILEPSGAVTRPRLAPKGGLVDVNVPNFNVLFRGKLPMLFPGPKTNYEELVERVVLCVKQNKSTSYWHRSNTEDHTASVRKNTHISFAA